MLPHPHPPFHMVLVKGKERWLASQKGSGYLGAPARVHTKRGRTQSL